jgi:hypothetical protein
MSTPWAILVENKVSLAHGHQGVGEKRLGTKVGQANTAEEAEFTDCK